VAGDNISAQHTALTASLVYLLIYSAMNLGAFAVVIAVARKTRSGDIASYGGLFNYAPGLAVLMTVFMFSLAGIPPLGGWFAKFYIIRAVFDSGTPWSVVLGVVVAVNTVIGLFYYASVPRQMWMNPVPHGDHTPVRIPAPLTAALGICLVVVLAVGVYPQVFAHMGDVARLGP
jgi:NADH-quinone oxidoreductase subunit N